MFLLSISSLPPHVTVPWRVPTGHEHPHDVHARVLDVTTFPQRPRAFTTSTARPQRLAIELKHSTTSTSPETSPTSPNEQQTVPTTSPTSSARPTGPQRLPQTARLVHNLVNDDAAADAVTGCCCINLQLQHSQRSRDARGDFQQLSTRPPSRLHHEDTPNGSSTTICSISMQPLLTRELFKTES